MVRYDTVPYQSGTGTGSVLLAQKIMMYKILETEN